MHINMVLTRRKSRDGAGPACEKAREFLWVPNVPYLLDCMRGRHAIRLTGENRRNQYTLLQIADDDRSRFRLATPMSVPWRSEQRGAAHVRQLTGRI